MLTFELAETDKHSIKILLRRKNLRFLRRTNLIKTRCKQAEKRANRTKQRVPKKAHIVFLPTFGIILTLKKKTIHI